MIKEKKVAETPVVPKVSDDESLIDNRRQEVEKLVVAENEKIPEPEKEEDVKPPLEKAAEEENKEEVKEEDIDPIERMKKSVQKRIDKVIAQKKSTEDELSEARSEIDRLRSKSQEPSPTKNDIPPTPEQVEAYILKMREEGNAKEEISATRYLIRLEKEMALKEVSDREEKTRREADEVRRKQDVDMKDLANDYVMYDEKGKPDAKSDLTLANKNGLLFQTAISLYNDVDLHSRFYNDQDIVRGFRRAVADAYRELHQQDIIKTPKGEKISELIRTPKVSLAEPDADLTEETPARSNFSPSLSDAEKVREEIKMRNKNRFIR